MVFRGGATHLRVRACAKTTGRFTADVELCVCIGKQQRLTIRVDGDEFDALQAFFDHAVNRVDATAADTDDADHGEVVVRRGHR